MSAAAPALALVAGALTILSPCVLPLAPIVATSALSKHKLGPIALATGLGLSFAAFGLFVATIGFALGVGSDALHLLGAAIMLVLGLTLLIPTLQRWFERLAAPLGDRAGTAMQRFSPDGVWGQAGLGALLGIVWSPCVGPTLGAATLLASEQRALPLAAAVMAAFGFGAALSLSAVGYGARLLTQQHRARLASAGRNGKRLLGALFVLLAVLTLTGLDHALEAFLAAHMPAWLTDLATRV